MIRLRDTGGDDTKVTTVTATPVASTPATTAPVVDVTATQKKLDKAYNLNLVTDTANMAKSSIDGLLYGAIGGLVCFYFLKKNIYWGAAFGALVGGVLGHASHQAGTNN